MTNPFRRGSAPGREQPDYLRPGSFKPGHEKRGGRKRGTPNAVSADYKRSILEAAYRVGNDGNGKDGLVGYFEWVGLRFPTIFYTVLLVSLLPHECAEDSTSEQPHRTKEESNEVFATTLGSRGRSRSKRQIARPKSRSPWDWTGQDFPVGSLMQLAVEEPKAFCTLIVAAFLRPPSKQQRGLAAGARGSSVSKLAASDDASPFGRSIEESGRCNKE